MSGGADVSDEYQHIASAWHCMPVDARGELALHETAQRPLHLALDQNLWQRWAGVSPAAFVRLLDSRRLKGLLAQPAGQPGADAPSPSPRGSGQGLLLEPMAGDAPATAGCGSELRYGACATPFGDLLLAFSGRASLCHAAFLQPGDNAGAALAAWGGWPRAHWQRDDPFAAAWLARSLRGSAAGTVLSPAGSDFQIEVWRGLLGIPPGRLVSYQQLAVLIGRPGAVRAVASAVARNPVAWLIPCHRVIRADGRIGNYRWGTARKQLMIGWEAARCGI